MTAQTKPHTLNQLPSCPVAQLPISPVEFQWLFGCWLTWTPRQSDTPRLEHEYSLMPNGRGRLWREHVARSTQHAARIVRVHDSDCSKKLNHLCGLCRTSQTIPVPHATPAQKTMLQFTFRLCTFNPLAIAAVVAAAIVVSSCLLAVQFSTPLCWMHLHY